jgi:hypothetical protein
VTERPRRTRSATLDPACAQAVELARAAAVEVAQDTALVGEHRGVSAEGDRLVLHRFDSRCPGYRGWEWAVVVARASRAKAVTVDEVVLLPGDDALIAPPWVPWSERLRPGDLRVGDLLPTAVDDERLVLRAADVDELSDDEMFDELGLGRPRVLSSVGREDAAERWCAGDAGPEAPIAKVAPAQCGGCGFLVRLVGALGRMFGVCANAFAPDDGRVVSFDHGCGAHSEALVLPSAHPQPVRYDDGEVEPLTAAPARPAGSVDDSEPAEPYGHS